MSQLNAIVSALVDALSSMVMESVGGSVKDIQTHAVALATQTQLLVDQAQKVALETDDNEVVNEIINSINFISDQINNLVESLTAMLPNRTNPTLVKQFSDQAQNVADAISALVNVTDETSQKRLISLDMESAAERTNRGDLVLAGGKFQEIHVKLADVCEMALAASAIPQKKTLLRGAAGSVRHSSPNLVDVLKHCFDEPQSAHWRNQHDQISQIIGQAYKDIIEAVKMEEASEFEKLRKIIQAIGFMIQSGAALQQSAGQLIKAFSTDAPSSQRKPLGLAMKGHADEMIKNAVTIRDLSTDPVVKNVVDGAIRTIERTVGALNGYAQQDKLSAANKGDAANAYEELMNAAQRLVSSTRSNAMQEYPVHMSTEALNNLLKSILTAADAQDTKAVLDYSLLAVTAAKDICNQLENLASRTTDPKEKKAYLDAAEKIRAGVTEVVNAAKNFVANPNSLEALGRLRDAIGETQSAIELARIMEGTPAGFAPIQIASAPKAAPKPAADFSFNAFELEPQPGDDELLRAAKEQALAALDIIREAERFLGQGADQDAKIYATSDQIRQLAQKVVDAARRAAANPDDAAAQAEMAKCQSELATAIATLLGLTGKGNNTAVAAAMKGLQDAVGTNASDSQTSKADSGDAQLAADFYKIAAEMIQVIKSNFKGNVKDDVQTSRDLAVLAAKANKSLVALSKTVKNAQFQDSLVKHGQIINDNSLKLKILAAVKVSGGNDETGQVASAADGLKVQVEEIVSQVKAGSLRHRLQATAKQITALKLIAEAVRKARLA